MQLFTAAQLARECGVQYATFHTLRRAGEFPTGRRVGIAYVYGQTEASRIRNYFQKRRQRIEAKKAFKCEIPDSPSRSTLSAQSKSFGSMTPSIPS
jgi:hypothetical protein